MSDSRVTTEAELMRHHGDTGQRFYESMDHVLDTANTFFGRDLVGAMVRHHEGQPPDEMAYTTQHSLRVAALMDMTLPASAPLSTRHQVHLAGFGHDVMKLFDPEINRLVWSGGMLTAPQFEVVRRHAQLGSEYLGQFLTPNVSPAGRIVMEAAIDDIARHHGDPGDSPTALLLQVADTADALMLDWTRTYKRERMTSEGLLGEGGEPNLDRIGQVVLRNRPPEVLGIDLEAFLTVSCGLMPANVAQPPRLAQDILCPRPLAS